MASILTREQLEEFARDRARWASRALALEVEVRYSVRRGWFMRLLSRVFRFSRLRRKQAKATVIPRYTTTHVVTVDSLPSDLGADAVVVATERGETQRMHTSTGARWDAKRAARWKKMHHRGKRWPRRLCRFK
jgi:hypothetical protein